MLNHPDLDHYDLSDLWALAEHEYTKEELYQYLTDYIGKKELNRFLYELLRDTDIQTDKLLSTNQLLEERNK